MPKSSHETSGELDREAPIEALHQLLFSWGKRCWVSAGTMLPAGMDASMAMQGGSARATPLVMGDVSLANWQQQTLTQLTHALTLELSKQGRDADVACVAHVQALQRAGEIGVMQCLERLERLCGAEMARVPSSIRARLASIKAGMH